MDEVLLSNELFYVLLNDVLLKMVAGRVTLFFFSIYWGVFLINIGAIDV
jgi:hypothetical protein